MCLIGWLGRRRQRLLRPVPLAGESSVARGRGGTSMTGVTVGACEKSGSKKKATG